MWVRSLGWEDPLEEGMASHSSILAWRTPWTGEPGGLQSMGVTESDTTEVTEHACMWFLLHSLALFLSPFSLSLSLLQNDCTDH